MKKLKSIWAIILLLVMAGSVAALLFERKVNSQRRPDSGSRVRTTLPDIIGPSPGSGAFGTSVAALPNGNIVITDPLFDIPGANDVGAVYLYNGFNRQMINRVTGGTAGDMIGSGGITVLKTGHYVISSPNWALPTGPVANAGAVTWGSSVSGVSGTVISTSNSFYGTTAGDGIGSGGMTALNGFGNYVFSSPNWDRNSTVDAGAVTWALGTMPSSGPLVWETRWSARPREIRSDIE